MFGLVRYELKGASESEVAFTAAWAATSLLKEKHKFLPSYVLILGKTILIIRLLIYKNRDLAKTAINLNAGVARKFILTLASDRDIQEFNRAFKHPFGGDEADVRVTLALNLFAQQVKLVERYKALVIKLCGVTDDGGDIELISVKDISLKPAPFEPIVSTRELQLKLPAVHCASVTTFTADTAPLIPAPALLPKDSEPFPHMEVPSRPWQLRKPRPWALDNASVNARFRAKYYNAEVFREEAVALSSDLPGLYLNLAGSSGNMTVSAAIGSIKVPPFRPVRWSGSAPSIPTAIEAKIPGRVAAPIPPFCPIRSMGVANEKGNCDGQSVVLPHATPDDKLGCQTNHRQVSKSWLRQGRSYNPGKRGRDDDTDEKSSV